MSSCHFITELTHNDVLFGRGSAAREFHGTRLFHQLCRAHKEEFYSTKRVETKNIVACRIMNTIKENGGRLLQPIPLMEAASRGFSRNENEHQQYGIVWEELDFKVALAKTKQCIRDMKNKDAKRGGAGSSPSVVPSVPSDLFQKTTLQNDQPPPSRLGSPSQTPPSQVTQQPDTLHQPPNLPMSSQKAVFFAPSNDTISGHNNKEGFPRNATSTSTTPSHPICSNGGIDDTTQLVEQTINTKDQQQPVVTNTTTFQLHRKKRALEQDTNDVSNIYDGAVFDNALAKETDPTMSQSQVVAKLSHSVDEEEVANQLLALMTLDEAPRFTTNMEQEEMRQMTQDEQLAAVTDLFGTNLPQFQSQKRLKRPDPKIMERKLLLSSMIRELERIPAHRKRALLEAFVKADASEFSNDRLHTFLKREDNDPKKGAERFVGYWTDRRNVFGPEKFTQPMTLSGALRDELTAIQSGVFQLLPQVDTSGRHLILKMMERDERDGYTTENLLRAYWYLTEVVSQSNKGNEFVLLIYSSRLGTLWDFDQVLEDNMFHLEQRCLPVRMISFHPICNPLLLYVLKPIAFAMMDRRIRTRTVLHDSSDCMTSVDSLARYGILKHMLPTYIGGTMELDTSQWIEERKAAEEQSQQSPLSQSWMTHDQPKPD